jgi:hypothetical protein
MPEYLAPGVYVEETSFRPKTIEGVSTSTAGFVGPTRFGPIKGEPALLTSFSDFERIYGGLDQLEYSGTRRPNYIAHSVRAFFEEGGKRLYVSRVFQANSGDGVATHTLTDGASPGVQTIDLRARHPGKASNVTVTFALRVGQNILSTEDGVKVLRGARDYDVVWVRDVSSPIDSPPGSGMLYWLERVPDDNRQVYRLRRRDPDDSDEDVRIVTVNVTVGAMGRFGETQTWQNLSFHPDHSQALTKVFAEKPTNRATELYVPLVVSTQLKNGVDIAEMLVAQMVTSPPLDPLDPQTPDAARTLSV